MDQIDSALARANAVAAAGPAPVQSQQVATYSPPSAPVRPRSLEDAMATAGTSVENWLGVKDDAFTLDKTKLKVEEVKVSLDLSEVKFGFGVRYTVGGRPNYIKSYDGVTEARGGKNWQAAVQQACNVDQTCKGQYDLADIPMVLLEDLEVPGDRANPKKIIPAGTRVGYTTSITGYGVFMNFINKIVPEYGTKAKINIKLFLTSRNGPTGAYSVMDFEALTN